MTARNDPPREKAKPAPGIRSGAPKKPAPKKPAPKKPASKKAASKKPASKKPASKKPASKKPASKKAEPKKPASKKAASKKAEPGKICGSDLTQGERLSMGHSHIQCGEWEAPPNLTAGSAIGASGGAPDGVAPTAPVPDVRIAAPWGFLPAPFDSISRPKPLGQIRSELGLRQLRLDRMIDYVRATSEILEIDPEIKAAGLQVLLDVSRDLAYRLRSEALAREAIDWEAAKRLTAKQELYSEMEELAELCMGRLRGAMNGGEFISPQEISQLAGALIKSNARRAALIGVDRKEAPDVQVNLAVRNTTIRPLAVAEELNIPIEALADAGDAIARALSGPMDPRG